MQSAHSCSLEIIDIFVVQEKILLNLVSSEKKTKKFVVILHCLKFAQHLRHKKTENASHKKQYFSTAWSCSFNNK